MKNEKISACLSLISMAFFIVTSYFCYNNINRKIANINYNHDTVIFNAQSGQSGLFINALDLLVEEDKEIASYSGIIEASYQGEEDTIYEFDIMMHNDSSYTKTQGVDGINNHEYTYEIKRNGIIIVPETEISSYDKNSEVLLTHQEISKEIGSIQYEIIIRFYSNTYDQSHLLNTNFNSRIYARGV